MNTSTSTAAIKTPNGLALNMQVKFDCESARMLNEYPDHSLSQTYKIVKVLANFQSHTHQYEVVLQNDKQENVGYVLAKDLIKV